MVSVRQADYQREFVNALEDATNIDVAVAFASAQGLDYENCRALMSTLLENGGTARILVDLQLAFTNPAFIEEILRWKGTGLNVDIRHFNVADQGLFHPKVYLLHYRADKSKAIVGSANWTREAFSKNIEYGVVIEGDHREYEISSIRSFFESAWNASESKPVDENVLDAYRPYWRRRQGFERKARRRAGSMWQRILDANIENSDFLFWPNEDSAFLLGLITARGTINWDVGLISIEHRTGGSAYSHNGQRGYIGKGNIQYRASDVVHYIPEHIRQRLTKLIRTGTIHINNRSALVTDIDIYLNDSESEFISTLRNFFGNRTSYKEFRIPREIIDAGRELQEEFLRGYGSICGLVSSGTYSPTKMHQVWLRPATENIQQFNQLVRLIENSIGYTTYKNRRRERDVAVKIRCEDWMDIGFGIEWMDSLVEEGARLNDALAPSEVL